jgi:hypothetical protein
MGIWWLSLIGLLRHSVKFCNHGVRDSKSPFLCEVGHCDGEEKNPDNIGDWVKA